MATDIRKRPKFRVAAAHDNDRFAEYICRDEAPGFVDITGPTNGHPSSVSYSSFGFEPHGIVKQRGGQGYCRRQICFRASGAKQKVVQTL
jgi:hypothetical protein